eukprot:1157781-Pelagomonas_calceolata.AAC.4
MRASAERVGEAVIMHVQENRSTASLPGCQNKEPGKPPHPQCASDRRYQMSIVQSALPGSTGRPPPSLSPPQPA